MRVATASDLLNIERSLLLEPGRSGPTFDQIERASRKVDG
jgi:hypothetical protein